MRLINFQGLNCYHNSIISIVGHLGVDFSCAFADLWSESDFRYDPIRDMFFSKRLIRNLEHLGVKLEIQLFSYPQEVKAAMSLLAIDEYFVVGMDGFYIPWNPHYQKTYGAHYFIAQYTGTETLCCFDPTYHKKEQELPYAIMFNHAFECNRIHMVPPGQPDAGYVREAQAVLRTHPKMCKKIMADISECLQKEQKEIVLLARIIDAMISNRYLFRCYLEQNQPPAKNLLYLRSDFLFRWFAVKNGLYKASICRGDEALLEEISNSFCSLIDEELEMASEMLSIWQTIEG